MKDKRKILIVGLVMIFVIAAIYVVVIRRLSGEVVTSELVTEVGSVESSDTGNSDTGDVTVSEATPEPAEATQEVVAVVPTVRAGLESTDPASLNLISGNIQLVEIFAFW
jgi:hypothetical protein